MCNFVIKNDVVFSLLSDVDTTEVQKLAMIKRFKKLKLDVLCFGKKVSIKRLQENELLLNDNILFSDNGAILICDVVY